MAAASAEDSAVFRGGFHRGVGFRHFGPRLAFGAPFVYGAYAG